MSEKNCIFCSIVSGAIPTEKIFVDELCVAFNDISPQAPIHILIIPKEHIRSLAEADEQQHKMLLGHLLVTASKIARDKGIAENGYRVVINTNDDGGQTVFHIHVHLLGGRPFIFPPG